MLKNNFVYFFLGLILLLHGFLFTKLIFFPYPELFIYPYLTNQGLLPYKQILDQHFPGLMFLPINFDNLGMTTPEIARIWLIGVVLVTHLLLFFIAKFLLKSSKKALFVNLLYLIWQPFFEGWTLWIDSFAPLLLLPAFYFTVKRKLLICGLFLGLAIILKQSFIPLTLFLLIYLLIDRKGLKEIWFFMLGLLTPLFLMILYIISIGVWLDFWYWNIVFNLTTYAKHGTAIPTTVSFVTRILLVYCASLIGIIHKEKRTVFILFIFLFGSFLTLFDRADFIHLQPSLPFVVLVTSLGFFSVRNKKLLVLIISIYILVVSWWLNIFYKGHIGNKVFFFDEQTYKIADKIMQLTKPKDKIFIYGAAPHLYQMSQTLPAGDIFVFQFPWFLQVAENRILEGLIMDQPKIVIYDTGYSVVKIYLKDFSPRIYQYIETNYKKIDNIDTVEILQRKN